MNKRHLNPKMGHTPITMTEPNSALRLWQLISSTLPVGAYSYSQGLETAVESAWVDSEDSAQEWICGQLLTNLAILDAPILKRLLVAWRTENRHKVRHWNAQLLASRESSELKAEDRYMGGALAKLLKDLGLQFDRAWLDYKPSFISMFALAAVSWNIDDTDTARGLLWSWCENQVMAAVKLIPLGQTAGQRLLFTLAEHIPAAVAKGYALADDEIGQLNPRLAIASALHETQYSRLFRS